MAGHQDRSEALDEDILGIEYAGDDPLADPDRLGTLVSPDGEGALDDEPDAVAFEAAREDAVDLPQDAGEVLPAEEAAMHLTEPPPMGDGDGYLDEG